MMLFKHFRSHVLVSIDKSIPPSLFHKPSCPPCHPPSRPLHSSLSLSYILPIISSSLTPRLFLHRFESVTMLFLPLNPLNPFSSLLSFSLLFPPLVFPPLLFPSLPFSSLLFSSIVFSHLYYSLLSPLFSPFECYRVNIYFFEERHTAITKHSTLGCYTSTSLYIRTH